jgi:hypothetical protein
MHPSDPTVTPTRINQFSLISGRDPCWGLSLVLLVLLGWLVAENRRLQAKVADLEAGQTIWPLNEAPTIALHRKKAQPG